MECFPIFPHSRLLYEYFCNRWRDQFVTALTDSYTGQHIQIALGMTYLTSSLVAIPIPFLLVIVIRMSDSAVQPFRKQYYNNLESLHQENRPTRLGHAKSRQSNLGLVGYIGQAGLYHRIAQTTLVYISIPILIHRLLYSTFHLNVNLVLGPKKDIF